MAERPFMLVGTGGFARFSKREPKPHLWVVIAEAGNNKVVAVNITAFRAGYDPACVFERGEYPIITKKSFVIYSETELLTKKTVLKKRFREIDPKMFAKIVAGALKSEYFFYKHLL